MSQAGAVKIILEKCEREALRASSIDQLLSKEKDVRDFFWSICVKYKPGSDPRSTIDASIREFGPYVKRPEVLALKSLYTSEPLLAKIYPSIYQLSQKAVSARKNFWDECHERVSLDDVIVLACLRLCEILGKEDGRDLGDP